MKSIRCLLYWGVCLLFALTFSACKEDEGNDWQDENETLFDKIGKETVVIPRNQINYSVYPVRDTVVYVEVNPQEVITHSSGLKYRILKKGNSNQKPFFTSVVKVHYEGRRINGTVFDTTYGPDSNGPFKTPVRGSAINGIIEGWTEILPEMSVGDKYEVYIPWYMGYGDEDSGSIAAYSTLIFIMELVDIVEL